MNENGSVLAEGYTPPTPADMHLPDFFQVDSLGLGFGKQMLLVILSVVVVSLFFMMAARKRAMVPGKAQFIAESGYLFTRNSLGKDLIGAQHFKPFVPLLFTSFFFILINNLYGSNSPYPTSFFFSPGQRLCIGHRRLPYLGWRRYQAQGTGWVFQRSDDAVRSSGVGVRYFGTD